MGRKILYLEPCFSFYLYEDLSSSNMLPSFNLPSMVSSSSVTPLKEVSVTPEKDSAIEKALDKLLGELESVPGVKKFQKCMSQSIKNEIK